MKQETPESEQKHLRQITDALEQRSSNYDAATLSALRQAREKALSAVNKKPTWFTNQTFSAVIASVSIFTIAVFLFGDSVFISQNNSSYATNDVLLDDRDAAVFLLSDDDTDDVDLEFYENIEFYEWLDKSDAG